MLKLYRISDTDGLAQRGVLKVLSFRPIRYPTFDLYNELKLLTVRKLYLLNVILRKHSELPYKTNPNKRRKARVCIIEYCRLEIARRHYYYLAYSLYNNNNNIIIINKTLNIYPLLPRKCKEHVTQWLLSLTYDATENLITREL